ncbi:uncharacterized protein LOC119324540 [Triticum dicoccoides]|uniref:uncharacterized protein LOC119324540 n=1 Tax=Triticum dicoccoides TaxID=85692 RepID=UPI00189125C5|nr:uncharacterized protein LOC119324540 [Triticum dicoccoides]XP_044412304.1 uncharacterized protein LOC123136861 [Triticum aestivum]
MSAACGAPAPTAAGVGEWRKDWPLRSGSFAMLSDKCGQMKAVEGHKGSLLFYMTSTHKGSLLHLQKVMMLAMVRGRNHEGMVCVASLTYICIKLREVMVKTCC